MMSWMFPFLQLHTDCRVINLCENNVGNEYALQKLPELHKFCIKFLSLYSAQLNRISIIGDIINDPVAIYHNPQADLPENIVASTLHEMAVAQHVMNMQMVDIESHRSAIISQTMQQLAKSSGGPVMARAGSNETSIDISLLTDCMQIFNRFIDIHQVGTTLICEFISAFCESKRPSKPCAAYRHMLGMACVNKFILLRILHADVITAYNMAHRLLAIGDCSMQYIDFYRVLIHHMNILIGNPTDIEKTDRTFSQELAKNIALLTRLIGAVIN